MTFLLTWCAASVLLAPLLGRFLSLNSQRAIPVVTDS